MQTLKFNKSGSYCGNKIFAPQYYDCVYVNVVRSKRIYKLNQLKICLPYNREIILGYLDEPSVITRALKCRRVRQKKPERYTSAKEAGEIQSMRGAQSSSPDFENEGNHEPGNASGLQKLRKSSGQQLARNWAPPFRYHMEPKLINNPSEL